MTGQTDNIDRQTERQTPDSFIDPALHTTRAASITDKCVYNSLEISTVISRAHTARVKAIVVEAGARFLSVADGSVCVEEAARAVRGPGKVEAATLGARQAGSPAVGQAASVRRRFTAADTHVSRHVRFRCGNVTKGRLHLLAATLVHAFVTSRVDQCNAVLAGATKSVTDTLQRVMNAAARVVSDTRKFDRGLTQILHDDLHWLDVADRVTYKLGVIMHRCRHGKAPQYLVDCCTPVTDVVGRQCLRSAT